MIHFEIRHPDVEGPIGEIKLHPESVPLLFNDIEDYLITHPAIASSGLIKDREESRKKHYSEKLELELKRKILRAFEVKQRSFTQYGLDEWFNGIKKFPEKYGLDFRIEDSIEAMKVRVKELIVSQWVEGE